MKKSLSKVSILLIVLLIISCVSLSEPIEGENALLVGQSIAVFSNFDGAGYPALDGEHKVGLTISIVDMNTGKKQTAYTNEEGMFVFEVVPGHSYYVRSMLIKARSGDGSWSEIRIGAEQNRFDIVSDGVFNIGTIVWEYHKFGNPEFLSTFKGFKEVSVKDLFMEKYPESEWNNAEWIQVSQ